MIKHGSKDQKTRIIDAIKPYCLKMMESKYSNHLVQKAYYYSPSHEQKKYFRKQINGQISKLIMYQNASEVIEYIYSNTDVEKERQQMVYSFYG